MLLGTTREGRLSIHPARLLAEEVARREGLETRVVDLREVDVPIDDVGLPTGDPEGKRAATERTPPIDTSRAAPLT